MTWTEAIREAPAPLVLPTLALIGATVFFGLFTAFNAGAARDAAEQLLVTLPGVESHEEPTPSPGGTEAPDSHGAHP